MKRQSTAIEIAVFCALCLGAGAFVVLARARANWDQDIWWHLRTGQWIAEHGTVPVTDPFSAFGRDKAWIAYSWLFDLIAHTAYQWFGLRGLVLLSAILGLLIVAALYTLVRNLGAPLAVAVPLTLIGFDAMMPLTTPRPWLFSMLFFLIELHVIVTARRSDRGGIPATLWLLPPVFIVWANMHVQFLIGFLVVAAAACDALWHERTAAAGADTNPAYVPAKTWLLLLVVCAAAALVNPYHIAVYTVARQLMAQTGLWTRIGELLAPDFRHSTDWITLALTLVAAGFIGWQLRQRSARVLLLLVFLLGAYFGFKSRRDTWLTITAAAAAIAAAPWHMILKRQDAARFPASVGAIVAPAMAVLMALGTGPFLSEEKLAANVARTYPAAAAAFIERQAHTGPLYNYFDWGGYLMWRLPKLPVQMDGRTVVHGEPRILAHVDTWQGKPTWRSDPELAAARIVVGPRDLPLASLLRLDERFKLVYEDREGPAVVFEAR